MLKNIISTLFTRGFVALINLAVLLVSCNQLGSDVRGQISLLVFNIAIIQIINEIYTGYVLVYFIPKYSVRRIYFFGVLWTIGCTLICAMVMYILFKAFNIGANEHWLHMMILSFLIILHSLHMVFILAKERIKTYNYLNFFQPALLLIVLLVAIFIFEQRHAGSYIIALYVSFLLAICVSSVQLLGIFKHAKDEHLGFDSKAIIEKGFYNQLANLCHILSNRYNFYLLGNTILVGIYSSATSLIESVWIISGSVSPIILTFIANDRDPANNGRLTLLLAKICFLLSLICVLIVFFIPRDFFVFILGDDFIHVKTVMLYLSPGILFISFATIISHYFAGLGKQRILLIANSAGFLTTVSTSYFLISRDQLLGACYAACLSYFVASLVLVIYFINENKLGLMDLFRFSGDFELLRRAK